MTVSRILLVGYYGKGNFGDDVLLKVTHGIVRQAFPNARVSVIIDGDHGEYVRQMLSDVEILKPGRYGQFDLIVHGGGGVYFDFKQHGLLDRVKERAIHLFGLRSYITAEKLARAFTNKRRTGAKVRLGMGIGVGTYTKGSPRLRASLPILVDYAALWVRDAESIANLKPFASAMKGDIIRGSDLAFLTEHWLPQVNARQASARPRLGIILRDWAKGAPEQEIKTTLAQLAERYDITGFIFDQHADALTMQLLAPYKTCVWKPEISTIADFSSELAAQDVLLTSRAHGAICGACLGVPIVIVAIESKLEQVVAMLPNASVMVSPTDTASWSAAIERASAIRNVTIAGDVATNRTRSEAALASMQRWLA